MLSKARLGHMLYFLQLRIEPHPKRWTESRQWMDPQSKFGAIQKGEIDAREAKTNVHCMMTLYLTLRVVIRIHCVFINP